MFSGEIDRSAFAWQVILRALLCFIVVPLALFLAVMAFASCAKDNSACFMGSILIGMFSAHFVYLLFALSCMGVIIRRLRKLQLPLFLVALPIVFFLADVQNGASFIHSLMTRITAPGVSNLTGFGVIPRYFLLAIVSLLALWILPDRERSEQSQFERWGIPGLMTFGMFVLLGIGATVEAIRTASILLPGVGPYQAVSDFMRYYYLYGNAIIVAVLAALTARWQRRASSKI